MLKDRGGGSPSVSQQDGPHIYSVTGIAVKSSNAQSDKKSKVGNSSHNERNLIVFSMWGIFAV